MKLRTMLLAATLAAASAVPATALADNSRAVHYYVSLGDSLAAGQQLDSDENFGDEGYADQLYALERPRMPSLKLVKLSCSGETTTSMALPVPLVPQGLYEGRGARYFCNFPHGSQLAEAVSFLHAHRGFVSFVTLDLGADDLLGPGGVAAVAANLPVILAALREAAGPTSRSSG
jgi:hypothetical protein